MYKLEIIYEIQGAPYFIWNIYNHDILIYNMVFLLEIDNSIEIDKDLVKIHYYGFYPININVFKKFVYLININNECNLFCNKVDHNILSYTNISYSNNKLIFSTILNNLICSEFIIALDNIEKQQFCKEIDKHINNLETMLLPYLNS